MIRPSKRNVFLNRLTGSTQVSSRRDVVASFSQFFTISGAPRANWFPERQRPINLIRVVRQHLTKPDRGVPSVLLERYGESQTVIERFSALRGHLTASHLAAHFVGGSKTMPDGSSQTIVIFQRMLDEGFQECMTIAKDMHETIMSKFAGGLDQRRIRDPRLAELVSPWINNLYKAMAATMFKVLSIMQPEDFRSGDVNFYFLPGYHSCLTDQRLFYREEVLVAASPTTLNFGVGLSGNPLKSPQGIVEYHDCCHARWYTFATTRWQAPGSRHDEAFRPGSPYQWFAYQQPSCSENLYDLIASLTFSTAPQDRASEQSREHITQHLDSPGCSQVWGRQVADTINAMPYKRIPDGIFPDRVDRRNDPKYNATLEVTLRNARSLLVSLWMHSVFEKEPPLWWDSLMNELRNQELKSVIDSVSLGYVDPIASNWGDQGLGRPQFNTWTTLSMHPLVAPPPTPLLESSEIDENGSADSQTYLQTVGWATMLSSVPLGLPFISVVRPWIRMIYGMLRSAEVKVLLRDQHLHHRAAQAARTISHDMHKFLGESVVTVMGEAEDCGEKAVNYRRFTLLLLRAQGDLAYAVCSAATEQEKVKGLRAKILASLQLVGDDLVQCLYQVATEVQHFRQWDDGGQVFPIAESELEIPVDTYVSCLFLVGEIIRNQCQHGKGQLANLKIKQDASGLRIELIAQEAGSAGHSYRLLGNALNTLNLGKATFTTIKTGIKTESRWIITINIPAGEDS